MKTRLSILLISLLLALPALATNAGGITPEEERTAVSSARLLGPLPELIEFYRSHSSLTPENWHAFQVKKQATLEKEPLPKAPSRGMVPITRERKNSAVRSGKRHIAGSGDGESAFSSPTVYSYFDPALHTQVGWPEDTFECILTFEADARSQKVENAHVIDMLPYNGGSIARIFVRGKDLEKVASLKGLQTMAPVYRRELNNDLGSAATNASRLRVGNDGAWDKERGYTGQGTIVGVIDSGLYFQHGDFVDPETGTTRVQYIWDTTVTTAGRTPAAVFGGDLAGLTTGTVWTKAEIDAGLCTEYDPASNVGHGTHTTGTAAGNGGATGMYTGMAPNADIVFVKGLTNNGIRFIYEMARLLGKPCAVNMSYGPSFALHQPAYNPSPWPMDPTDLDGQWIDALNQYYGGGHIPVKSAGNNGNWNTYTDTSSGGSYPYKQGGTHWGTTLDAPSTHVLTVPDYDPLFMSIWGYYPGPLDVLRLYFGCWLDTPANVTVTDPYGGAYTFTFGAASTYYDTADGNRIYGQIFATPQANGAYYGRFNIFPIYGYNGYSGVPYQPTIGQWQITVTPQTPGPGNADFWVADYELWHGGLYYFDYDIYSAFAGSSSMSSYIVDEGATPFEITAGAWTTRDGWDSIDGHHYSYTARPWLGYIADFSSPGPARDRFMKPDIAAPGNIIISALSQTGGQGVAYTTPDNAHQAMSGTSMSAPHVTGGAALVLQKYPATTVDGMRQILQGWATNDAYTQANGANAFGAGKLNVLPLNEPPVAVVAVDKEELILDDGDKASFDGSASHDTEGFPLSYSWSLVSAPAGAAPTLTPSGRTAVLDPDPDIEGTYQVGLVVNDTIADSRMATASVLARFYPVLPPSQAAIQRLEDDYIFYKEYVNKLTWQANPENKSTLANYKVYRKAKGADDASYALVATLAPTVMQYEEKGLKKDQLYTYKITAVNLRGKESDPVVVSN